MKEDPSKNFTTQTAQYRGNCEEGFSSTEIGDIGSLHNQVVVNVFDGFNFSAFDLLTQAKSQFAAAYPGLTSGEIDDFFTLGMSEVDLEDHDEKLDDVTLVHTYYDNLLYILENSSDLSSLQSSLQSLKGDVNNNLSCTDLDFMLVCLSITINSATLWSPTTLGGDGLYDSVTISKGITGIANDRDWTWRSVVKGDLAGATSAFFSYGLGLTVPGTNAAVAGVIGYSAAAGSVGVMLFGE